MDILSSLLTVAIAQEGGGGAAGLFASPLVMFALMFGIIYLLLIRPQQKQQKKHRELLESLKKGDRVVTQSGIFGKIASIDGNVVTLEVDHKVNIRMLKSNIATLEVVSSPEKGKESGGEKPAEK